MTASNRGAPLLSALAELPQDESLLLRHRYGIGDEPLNAPAIAQHLGVSPADIIEMEAQALIALALSLIATAGVLDSTEPEQ